MAWCLAIDFGTTITTAAVCDDRDPVARTVNFGSSDRFPSAVMVGATDLLSGADVLLQARFEPSRLVQSPKRLIGHGFIRAAGRRVSEVDLFAAVLSVAYREALRLYNGDPPAGVALTYPARWAKPRMDCLEAAAVCAGIENITFVPEPVAAARALLRRDDVASSVDPGAPVAVFDWGGGTLDIALMRRDEAEFRSFSMPAGDEHLGGEDLDEALLGHIVARLPEADREGLETVFGATPARQWERAYFDLRQSVRVAKEQLSTHRQWKLILSQPPFSVEYLDLTESDLRAVIGTYIERAVRTLESLLLRNEMSFEDLGAIFLTGGTSRLAIIQRRLGPLVGGRLATWGDPKALVAIGAAEFMSQQQLSAEADRVRRYERARRAEDLADWGTAVHEYVGLLQDDPNYRDASERRGVCVRQMSIAQVESQIGGHWRTRSWGKVLEALKELTRIDPDYAARPAGVELATRAREELEGQMLMVARGKSSLENLDAVISALDDLLILDPECIAAREMWEDFYTRPRNNPSPDQSTVTLEVRAPAFATTPVGRPTALEDLVNEQLTNEAPPRFGREARVSVIVAGVAAALLVIMIIVIASHNSSSAQPTNSPPQLSFKLAPGWSVLIWNSDGSLGIGKNDVDGVGTMGVYTNTATSTAQEALAAYRQDDHKGNQGPVQDCVPLHAVTVGGKSGEEEGFLDQRFSPTECDIWWVSISNSNEYYWDVEDDASTTSALLQDDAAMQATVNWHV